MWKKFYSEQITQAQKVEEERVRISEEGAKETAAQMRAVTRKETQINLDNLRQLRGTVKQRHTKCFCRQREHDIDQGDDRG